jgi:hypothetical protein
MSRLPLDQVSPGMVLAGDARDRQGRLLLPAGRELCRRTLDSLRFWGVQSLDVVGGVVAPGPEVQVSPGLMERAQTEVASHFANAGPPHPFLDLLRSLAVERRAREMAADGRP